MDWNKSNSILIIAFLVVNIFLFSFIYLGDNIVNKYDLEEREEFLNNVKEILKTKNITILCDVPIKGHEAPFLEIKYNMIYPSKELVENFIGEYNDTINDEIMFYQNEFESIEIVGRKKIIYKNEKAVNSEIKSAEFVDNIINDFCYEKNIDLKGHSKTFESDKDGLKLVRFTKKYKGHGLENSYMNFYIKGDSIVRFEMQNIQSIVERAKIESISATSALLRLMAIDYINNKEITNIQICYYTSEDEDFENINSINVDLVWKVMFSDNSYVYLIGEDY